jgi:UDP-2,3-diacylglucosamine hydrolase
VPAVVIVSDAHLGLSASPDDFLRFLARVPDLGSHLVVNGDLFDFWFEYGTVIPRRAFRVLSALHGLTAAGIRLTVTGGNHDRWGGRFWRDELGAAFHPDGTRLELAGWRCAVLHGDGMNDTHAGARVMHRVTRWPATAAAFRWLHPDVGLRLVDALSGRLGRATRRAAVLERAAAAQAEWARDFLDREPDVDVLVMGHTHRPVLERVAPGRWYVNPGAWCDGRCYAVLTQSGPALRTFEPG